MVKQDYDQLAEVYGRNRKLHPLVLKQLVSLGRLTDESRVLEIGCGIGNYIKTIAAKTGAICTGMDPSREMLRIAQSNHGLPKNRRDSGGADVTFIKGKARRRRCRLPTANSIWHSPLMSSITCRREIPLHMSSSAS